jgi:hypothetical protein
MDKIAGKYGVTLFIPGDERTFCRLLLAAYFMISKTSIYLSRLCVYNQAVSPCFSCGKLSVLKSQTVPLESLKHSLGFLSSKP